MVLEYLVVYSDHNSLILIFKKEVNEFVARLQWFKLGLIKYDIELLFVPWKKNLLADLLSSFYFKNDLNYEPESDNFVHEVVLSPEKCY